MIEVCTKKNKKSMLEKILRAEGTQKLTEKEQKNIQGGNYPPGICYDYQIGYYKC